MRIDDFCIGENATIREALKIINDCGKYIAIVVDDSKKPVGTITDGDVRRGLLRGFGPDDFVYNIYKRKPVICKISDSKDEIMEKMTTYSINQILVVDEEDRVIGVDFVDEQYIKATKRNNIVVLMAGGQGTRLRPYTKKCPKPMLEVGGKPILHYIIENMVHDGFCRFLISVNYLGEKIKKYFGSGDKFGCEINYVQEDMPKGTAGALSALPAKPDNAFFVMNGDLLTTLNFNHVLDFHNEHMGAATICVKEHRHEVPYGVIKTDDHRVVGLAEKPIQSMLVNAGIYVLDPLILDFVPEDKPFDMTQLIQLLLDKGYPVFSFPLMEPWMDVGRPGDFERAVSDYMHFQREEK